MTPIRTTSILLTLVGAFGLSACRDKPTCLDCEDAAEADDNDASSPDLPPGTDLPCGGADLMTDNLNCGTCGHECGLSFPGTEYESGNCNAGKCGPGWSDCIFDEGPPSANCAGVCAGFGHTCIPNGCAGLTGMMSDVIFGQGCGDVPALATFSGSCDEPIPWMTPAEHTLEVQCCCDFQG